MSEHSVDITYLELAEITVDHIRKRGIYPMDATHLYMVAVPDFTGFTLRVVFTIPDAQRPTAAQSWRSVLELPLAGPVTRAQVEAAYRRLVRKRHPDRGGTNEAMTQLNAARGAALKEVVR